MVCLWGLNLKNINYRELVNVTSRHLSFLEEGEYRAEVHYIFQLRRRAIFYIAVLVIPIYLISLLSILGIFTPSTETGQRNEKGKN